jgi:hypothetical protein
MPRFVILEHDHPELHWDFMLEDHGVLRTWRLAAPPVLGQSCAAQRLPDHRLVYLDYEGPVSGHRGQVRRWERGSYDWLRDSAENLSVRLVGERLRGVMKLTQHSGEEWIAEFLTETATQ